MFLLEPLPKTPTKVKTKFRIFYLQSEKVKALYKLEENFYEL